MNTRPLKSETLMELNREKAELTDFLENSSHSFGSSINGAIVAKLGEVNREIKRICKEDEANV